MSFEKALNQKGYQLQIIKRNRPFEDVIVVVGNLVFVSGHVAKEYVRVAFDNFCINKYLLNVNS